MALAWQISAPLFLKLLFGGLFMPLVILLMDEHHMLLLGLVLRSSNWLLCQLGILRCQTFATWGLLGAAVQAYLDTSNHELGHYDWTYFVFL